MKTPRKRWLLTTLFLASGGALSLGAWSQAQLLDVGSVPADPVPSSVEACVPTWPLRVQRVELQARVTYRGREYYRLSGYSSVIPQPDERYPTTDLVISRAGSTCELHWDDPDGTNALEMQFPRELAVSLVRDQYEREIAEIGRAAFVEHVEQVGAQEPPPQWWREEVLALERLGIAVPARVEVIDPPKIDPANLTPPEEEAR